MKGAATVGDAGLRIALLGLAVLAGTAAQLQQSALWSPAAYASWFGLGAMLVGAAWRWRRAGIAGAIGVALLAFAVTGLRAQWRLVDALAPDLEGRDLVVVGVVSQLPRRLPDGVRFTFEVEQATRDGRPIQVPSRLSLGWYSGFHEDQALLLAPYADLAAGQRWRFAVRLKQPHGSLNPHGFDHELWMFEQGLRATGYVRATDRRGAERLGVTQGAWVERARQALRDAIESRVADPRAAGVLAALAVGDQAAIERGDWDLFRATGTAHLVAISGLHITMFAWLASALIRRAWRLSSRAMLACPAPTAARWGGLACATAYALLAGWGVPAQRTVWMLAAAALLAQLGLRWPWPLVLVVVAGLVIAIDPWALLSAGFWLSFVAVGLLLVAEPGAREPAAGGRLHALVHPLRHGLRTQVVATLGLAPLTLVLFQQLSMVGFVANLLAIPLITLLVTPLALAGVLLPPLWQLSAWLVQGLTAALGALAAWPGAVWSAPVAPWWAQAAALGGAALLVAPLPWRQRALALPLVLPLLWPAVERPAEGAMQVTVADVGQGSAILVRTRSHALLHDTGAAWSRDADAGTRVLVPLLRAIGVKRLDVLMLSHRDSDHVGGAAAILSSMPVAELSSSLEATHPLLAVAKTHRRCEAGQSWTWDGVRFAVLHPRAEDHARTDAKPNTLSCVLSVTDARGQRVLLTGDLEAEQEARLVREQPQALRADVLLVPHHGSKTSSSPAFLDAVKPRVALVQAGYRNRFGHPASEVAARYAERGIPLIGTTPCGAWTASSDGASVCERERRRRYWHHGPEVAASAEEETRTSWPFTSR